MNIRIDEKNLTAASVMPLFEAAQKIADMTGELVTINAYDGIKFEPASKDDIDAPIMPNIEPHKWPDLNDSNSSKGSDGWIEWHGGECPYPNHLRVQCKMRDGDIFDGLAGNIEWAHEFYTADIVAHRPYSVPCTITTSSLLKDQAS